MPDDDRHTRDRVRTLDPLCGEIRGLAARIRAEAREPRQRELPLDTARVRARKTLKQITDKLGEPDLCKAAKQAKAQAERIREKGPHSVDLCAGTRASGMQALLDQAVSVVLSSEDPADLMDMEAGELAAMVGEHFVLGALRRYGLDRLAPFGEEGTLGAEDALDFLELADLTFSTAILRALVQPFLR
ncbi:hypothetical protein [Nocardiopsis sp. RV163]|uniref:hypothetical protein n=1 Tax=Nocardiopsis sp. RV163 TaxID=1661388 RepID=UPI00064C16E8|nr:hypothetical protein [Nocardiopsis sp. RV163]